MSRSGSGSDPDPAAQATGWKAEIIEEATDWLRDRLEREACHATGLKSRVLSEAREHVDKLERALKRRA
jgi:hypothetical protein